MSKLKVNKSTKRWLVDGDCSKCERNVFGKCFRPCLMSDHHGFGDVRMIINESMRISLGAYRTNMPFSSCSKNNRKDD